VHPILTTERLLLRPPTLDTVRDLVAGGTGGLVLADGYPTADSWDVLRLVAEHGATDDDAPWFIVERDTGTVIGDCGTKGWTDDDGVVEIGYGLVASARGRGYGTEAVRALVGWVAAQPGVRRITAEVDPANHASAHVLEKCGFDRARSVGGYDRYEYRVTDIT
jgi:[ribosomal protein S5]-alanine N-acetyltransferase